MKPLLFGLLALIPLTAAAADPPAANPVYAQAKYDPKANADADLARAKTLAAPDNRRILLVVGGDWCPWCRAISKYLDSDTAVSALLARNYVIQKVCVSDDVSNTGFLNPYPAIEAYPHLFFLDREGKLLHSQDTGVLEKSGAYDEARFVALLQKWSAAK